MPPRPASPTHTLKDGENQLNLLTSHPRITPVIWVYYFCETPGSDRGASVVWVTKKEAAELLGLSIETIDRRLKRGELQGKKQSRPQGFTWLIEVSDELDNQSGTGESPQLGTPVMAPQSTPDMTGEIHRLEELVAALKDEVSLLQHQLAAQQTQLESKDKQIEQLHILLQQAQAALPAPRDNRPWWQRLWRRD